MAFMLKVTGADPDKFTADEWANAIDRLRKVVRAGHVRAFTGNEYIQDLTAGNIVACEAWSGDVISAQGDNPDIKFVVPEEGLSLWSDNMIVPNKAEHRGNAEKWIDFYYEPEVAAKLAAYVNYICPVEGARDAMVKIDDSLVDNPLIFPSEEDLEGHVRLHGAQRRRGTTVRRRVFRCHRWLKHPPRPAAHHVRRSAATQPDQGVRGVHRREVARPRRAERLVLRPVGAVGLRQDDDAADGRGTGDAHLRDDHARWQGHHLGQALPPTGQHRLPELRPVPAPRHLRERRLRPAPAQEHGGRAEGPGDAGSGRARDAGAQEAGPALRWSAAARRPGPCA